MLKYCRFTAEASGNSNNNNHHLRNNTIITSISSGLSLRNSVRPSMQSPTAE